MQEWAKNTPANYNQKNIETFGQSILDAEKIEKLVYRRRATLALYGRKMVRKQ